MLILSKNCWVWLTVWKNFITFRRKMMILTDHKPLITISKKALVNAPPRLQRLLLRLNNYNVELQWIPGKQMIFRDHLSRNVDTTASKPNTVPTFLHSQISRFFPGFYTKFQVQFSFFKCGLHIQLGKCLHFIYYFYTILSTLPKSMYTSPYSHP